MHLHTSSLQLPPDRRNEPESDLQRSKLIIVCNQCLIIVRNSTEKKEIHDIHKISVTATTTILLGKQMLTDPITFFKWGASLQRLNVTWNVALPQPAPTGPCIFVARLTDMGSLSRKRNIAEFRAPMTSQISHPKVKKKMLDNLLCLALSSTMTASNGEKLISQH